VGRGGSGTESGTWAVPEGGLRAASQHATSGRDVGPLADNHPGRRRVPGRYLERKGRVLDESVGTSLMRNICHYWFHTGEAHAIRQMLGHGELPQFVGDMAAATYRPE
jgi:hypothetical protein